MSSQNHSMLSSEQRISEALRLHSDTLNADRLSNLSPSENQKNRFFRRRSSSLCLGNSSVVLEPCRELSQDEGTTTEASSTGEPELSKEGPILPVSDRFKVTQYHPSMSCGWLALICVARSLRLQPKSQASFRRHSITTAAISLEHIHGPTLELIMGQVRREAATT
jgi:hypothetical protein